MSKAVTTEKEMWLRVDRVPWVFSELLDSSSEAYFIPCKSLACLGGNIRELVAGRFPNVKSIAERNGYYIFLGRRE